LPNIPSGFGWLLMCGGFHGFISTIYQVTLSINSNSHYKNRFFESPPTAGFQKTDFGVLSAFGT
jgi:hypothetical protein